MNPTSSISPFNPVVDALLKPVSADSPAGEPLRYTGIYEEIQNARAADDGLAKGVWQTTEKHADWPLVQKLATAALTTRGKDLVVAVLLAEAWIKLSGVSGLRLGLQLLTGLHQEFLLSMHPCGSAANAAGPLSAAVIGYRANMIQAFNDRCALALKFIPMAAPSAMTDFPYTYADLEKVRYFMQGNRSSNSNYEDEAESANAALERFEREERLTPAAFYVTLQNDVAAAQEELTRLDGLLDQAYARENGGLGHIAEVLSAVAQRIAPHIPQREPDALEATLVPPASSAPDVSYISLEQDIAYDQGAIETEDGLASNANGLDEGSPALAQQALRTGNPVASRADAYRQLGQIADFLARIEPHSPVPFLLQRAIRWGSLSLPELMAELMQQPNSLQDFQQMLQVPYPLHSE